MSDDLYQKAIWDRLAHIRLQWRYDGHTGEGMKMPKQRVKNAHISSERVDFKPGIGGKAQQAWKYPNGNILRNASTRIGGKDYFDHPRAGDSGKNLARRKQESNWFVTINTNKCPRGAAMTAKVMAALDQMNKHLATDAVLATYLQYGPCHDTYKEDLYDDVVSNVTTQMNVEIGPEKGRAHVHAIIKIVHYSQLQLNYPVLGNIAKAAFNKHFTKDDPMRMTKKPHVKGKLLAQSNWVDVLVGYVHKGMASKKPAPPRAGDLE